MPCHHNPHHPHSNPSFCCCHCSIITTPPCSCSCSCSCTKPPPPPAAAASSSTSDQLLLLLQSLVNSSHHLQPPIILTPSPPANPKLHHLHKSKLHHQIHDANDDPSVDLLNSLIRRISALESSVHKPHHHHQKQSSKYDAAAAAAATAATTIQRHFRRFLARRSRTLRHLKTLTSIKSHAAALRSDLNHSKASINPRALSRRTSHLLFQLESIQSSDAMIREGKRKVSKELVRIAEFVDKVLMARENGDGVDDELFQMRSKCTGGRRRVVFVENGDDNNVFDEMAERVLELDEEGREGSAKVVSFGFLGLAPPMPVKMEPRRNGALPVKNATLDEEEEEEEEEDE